MEILEGLLTINGVDIYTTYGAFLAERRADENANYNALLAMPKIKDIPEVSFREEDGVRSPSEITIAYEARDVELQFAIVAATDADFMQKYMSFLAFLKAGNNGWLLMAVPEIGRNFTMRLADAGEYSQITPFGSDKVAALFTLRFREPRPFENS